MRSRRDTCFHLSQLAYVIQHLDHAATAAPSDVRVRFLRSLPCPLHPSLDPRAATCVISPDRGQEQQSCNLGPTRGRKEALKPRRGQRIEPFDVGGRLPAPGGRDGAPPEDAFQSPTLLQLINYRQDSSEGGCDTARRKKMITAATMVVPLTAVGRTKIDTAFRRNVSHAQNMHYAVMHVSVYSCATPHSLPGARKQQCTQQGF